MVVRRRILMQVVASVARQAPTDHGCLECAAGLMIVPPAIDVGAGERQLIRAAVVFTKYLDRQASRRGSSAVELGQSSFACCHLLSPNAAARLRRISQKSSPGFSIAINHNA
jgi:hypothetical protein